METELKTEEISLSLDELFKQLGECTYLIMRAGNYLEELKEDRINILKNIELQYDKQTNSEDMGNEG
jgi:hypothetical protein